MKSIKSIRIALLLVLLAFNTVFAQSTSTRQIGPFDEILAFGQVEVHIVEGDEGSLKIETENLGIDKVITSLAGQQLTLKLQPGIYPKDQLARIYLSVGTLREIKAQAGAKVFSDIPLTGDKIVISARSGARINLAVEVNVLELRATEGARLELAGTSKSLEGAANNGGILDAEHLTCENVFIKSQVGAVAKVRATHKLEGIARTGGKLIHYGNPDEKDIQTSLGGTVECVCGG